MRIILFVGFCVTAGLSAAQEAPDNQWIKKIDPAVFGQATNLLLCMSEFLYQANIPNVSPKELPTRKPTRTEAFEVALKMTTNHPVIAQNYQLLRTAAFIAMNGSHEPMKLAPLLMLIAFHESPDDAAVFAKTVATFCCE